MQSLRVTLGGFFVAKVADEQFRSRHDCHGDERQRNFRELLFRQNRQSRRHNVDFRVQGDKTFAAPTGTKTVDASNVSKNFVLTGNDYYNVLIDGNGVQTLRGDTGNDSLTGVKGKDTLTGGNGSDVFVCEKGDGKDFIFGFGNDDLLEIVGLGQKVTGTFNKSGDELTVKAGSTTVAVFKDFSATTFNVNKNATNHRSKNFFRRLEG